MKRNIICLFIGLSACTSVPKDHFILQGTIPGAMDSTEICLTPANKSWEPIAKGYIINEKFKLQGKIDFPTLCKLSMNNSVVTERQENHNKYTIKYKEIDFFMENGKLEFNTPHIDSLPSSFWQYDIRKEKNYTLSGSQTQEIYALYQQQTLPIRHTIRTLETAYAHSQDIATYKQIAQEKENLRSQTWTFIRNQQNLPVNLCLAEKLKKGPFTYDQQYLQDLQLLFAPYQDTCIQLREFRHYLQTAAAFVQDCPLKPMNLIDTKGKTIAILPLLNKNGYTLIDFWASWCGPCRASFPHLKEMHQFYGEQITFISLSVDQKENDWHKAIKEEQLPWQQYLLPQTHTKDIAEWYDLTSVPTFLVIDSQGHIIYSGHSAGDLELLFKRYTES